MSVHNQGKATPASSKTLVTLQATVSLTGEIERLQVRSRSFSSGDDLEVALPRDEMGYRMRDLNQAAALWCMILDGNVTTW